MTKFSKVQEEILNRAKAEIDFARDHNFYDWYRHVFNCNFYTDERIDERMKEQEEKWNGIGGKAYEEDHYNRYRNGITLVTANTRTLAALEKLGAIRIVKEGGSYPDWIEVIGY